MNEIEIIKLNKRSDLFSLLVYGKAKYIGSGATSNCFLLSDGTVLKIYKETKKKKKLFSYYSMLEHIKLLSTLKNESYITPIAVYMLDDEVVAYKAQYKKAKTLERINPNTKISSVLENLDYLMEDTYLISDKHFLLKDLHDRNMLFNGYFYIIDLDFGHIEENDTESINRSNNREIMEVLLKSLFNVKDYELLNIYDLEVFKLYNIAIYKDYKNIYLFFHELQELLKEKELKVKSLRKHNNLITKEYDSYYKPDYY